MPNTDNRDISVISDPENAAFQLSERLIKQFKPGILRHLSENIGRIPRFEAGKIIGQFQAFRDNSPEQPFAFDVILRDGDHIVGHIEFEVVPTGWGAAQIVHKSGDTEDDNHTDSGR